MINYDLKKLIYFLLLNLVILSSLIFLLRPSWEIGSDGYGYYAYLRSYVFDHDFDFYNEYEQFDNLYGTQMAPRFTEIGKVGNLFSIGPSIFWTPFFIIGHTIAQYYPVANSYPLLGYNAPYQAAIALGSIVYFFLGLIFLYAGLKKLFTERIAFWVCSFLWLISPLIFYAFYEPAMSHALSFFAVSGLFYFFTRFKTELKAWHFLIFGLWLGFAMLIRWQNLLFIILPLALLFDRNFRWLQKILGFFLLLISSLLIFLPQLLMWNYLFGSYIAVPQGPEFFDLLQPHVWQFLFSGYHGLFIWHPLLFLGLIGLFFKLKDNLYLKLTLLFTLILQIYLNSALSDWMAGGSFGSRRLDGSLVIFAVGFGFLLEYIKDKKPLLVSFSILISLGIIWNLLLMISTAVGILPLNAPVTIMQVLLAPLQTLLSFKIN